MGEIGALAWESEAKSEESEENYTNKGKKL